MLVALPFGLNLLEQRGFCSFQVVKEIHLCL
jgi:hypothetical protein